MTTRTETKPFGGYGIAIRTFRVKGVNLTVSRRWDRKSYVNSDADGRFVTSIMGTAISEKDDVHIIGEEDRGTKEFSLTIKSDECAAQEWKLWEEQKGKKLRELIAANGEGTPELQLTAENFENLSNDPPTATLFHDEDDWELGIKEGWAIECAIPPATFAQLESDLRAQRVHDLYLGIEWEGGLVKYENAPPSVSNSWGLLRMNEKKNPWPLHGHLGLIGWRASKEPLAETHQNIEGVVDRLSNAFTGQMLSLARNCAIGFFVVAVLILFAHFLR